MNNVQVAGFVDGDNSIVHSITSELDGIICDGSTMLDAKGHVLLEMK